MPPPPVQNTAASAANASATVPSATAADDLVTSGVLGNPVHWGGGLGSTVLTSDAFSTGSPAPASSSASGLPPASAAAAPPAAGHAGAAAAAGMAASTPAFPVWALQPKKETGARAFLSKYPEYDGRGTIIAVLDSGVDPGAGGLQVTTDGRRKLIDRIDASGAGDVDMSKMAEADEAGRLKGATGRMLTLPEELRGKKGLSYRLGCKRVFPLFPRSLRDRMVKERQEKAWDPQHKLKTAEAARRMQEFETDMMNEGTSTSSLTGMTKLRKDNLDAEQELLNTFDKKFKETNGGGDLGPVYDIVLFHDGDTWVCLIDTSETGDLSSAVRLRPFRETGDYAPLTKEDKCNVSVNVYDEGKVLQLVSMCSSHGTHVASISAAHFPDEPEKNGLAPGAQVVSITIGDARLHSMETGTALVRAMVHIMQAEHYKVDVINMSYGEHSHWSNTGRVGELMGEVINKHGVVWVASAGNDGPALSTVGTPPDIATNTVVGVGAYVSPEMMVALYSTREKLPGTPYTWTSRGPTIDGDRGVAVCAPGGAITSVPHFTRRGTQLMNGTSMASPHVAGSVALLLSGMKKLSLPYSPFSVKRALENSALPLPHNCHFAQGHGLLQVDGAFDHLTRHSSAAERDVRFIVTCHANSKGIHIRKCSSSDALEKQDVPVRVEPVFLDASSVPPESQIGFNLRLALACQASWVSFPDFLDLMYCTRHFVVSIDPSGLTPGAHTAYVKAYDVADPRKGHLFEIPITLVIPEPLVALPRPHVSYSKVSFGSGTIQRHFLPVPQNATWAVIRVHSNETSASGKFVIHTVQLAPKLVVRSYENHRMFNLQAMGEFVHAIPVRELQVLEVCLAKWWAHIGAVECSYSVTFHGLASDRGGVGGQGGEVTFHGAEGITRVEVSSLLHAEEVQPEIKLRSLVQNFRPHESKVVPLGPRDVVPPNRQIYELQLAYNFPLSKSAEITPNFPWLSSVLYESEYESQLWMLYNSHKQLVACGDAFPSKWAAKVDKEDYTLKVHVRSENRQALDKLTDLPLMLSTKLTNSVTMDVYGSFDQASTGGKKASNFTLCKGGIQPVYVTSLSGADKYLKNSTQGQYLQGTMTLAKDEMGKRVDSIRVKYVLHEGAKNNKEKASAAAAKGAGSKGKGKQEQQPAQASASTGEKSAESTSASSSATPAKAAGAKKNGSPERLADSLREYKITWLGKQDFKSEEAKATFEELKNTEKANQVQIRMARLNCMDFDDKFSLEPTPDQKEKAEAAAEICREVLNLVKVKDVLAHSALKHDARADAADVRKEMERQRGWYVEAACKLGLAQLCLGKPKEEATETLLDLLRMCDPSEPRAAAFVSHHAEAVGHIARALRAAMAQLEAKPGTVELEHRILHLAEKMGWAHVHSFGKKSLELRYPDSYELF